MARLTEILLFFLCLMGTMPRMLVAILWCWIRQPGSIGSAPGEPAISEKDWDLVCISHVEWNHPWQRNQHVMSRLARERKVLYCYPVKVRALRNHWRRVLRMVLRPEEGNLWLLYFLVIPGSRICRPIDALNTWLLAGTIRALSRRAGLRRLVLWYYFPDQVGLRGRLGEVTCVYDIQDNYGHFPWASPDLGRREKQLLASADFVFTGTDALREANEARAHRIEFIPCGVEFRHFHGVREKSPPVPEGLRHLRKPVLGYFGLIDDRLNLKLIEGLARRHPEWQFLLLGPGYASAQPIEPLPNIHFPGAVPYADLPRHAQLFDVCLMPFVLNALTLAINPTKTLEYFALERPVVSSRIPDMVKFYSAVIDFADTTEEWERAIERALQPDPARIGQALAIARERSWESIADRFAQRIGETIVRNSHFGE